MDSLKNLSLQDLSSPGPSTLDRGKQPEGPPPAKWHHHWNDTQKTLYWDYPGGNEFKFKTPPGYEPGPDSDDEPEYIKEQKAREDPASATFGANPYLE